MADRAGGADPASPLPAAALGPCGTPPLRERRVITGMSAILLAVDDQGRPDWDAVAAHVARTHAVGLWPAVNMDTGYAQLIDEDTRTRVLDLTAELTGGRFVAGAYVPDGPGDAFDDVAYAAAMAQVRERGGTPVVFPSHGLNALDDAGWVAAHETLARHCDRFVGFELGPMFVPYGRIYSLAAYEGLLGIEACIGAKHSSLRRQPEWDRLALRDRLRPDFMVLTGNDLAIDMVRWGSDYLLGLSTFAPDAFARRDALWAAGDPRVFELDDLLQHLGGLTFRFPTPGYRHDAAMFLQLRGWIDHDGVWPGAQRRPVSDRDLLAGIVERLDALLDETADVVTGPMADDADGRTERRVPPPGP